VVIIVVAFWVVVIIVVACWVVVIIVVIVVACGLWSSLLWLVGL
jgi:hypothetical protein